MTPTEHDDEVWAALVEDKVDFDDSGDSDEDKVDLKSILVMSWISFLEEGEVVNHDDHSQVKTSKWVWIYLLKNHIMVSLRR